MCIIHLHSFTVYSFITRFIVPPRRKYFTTLYFPQLRSFLGRNMCIARACVRKTCVQVPTRSSNASATHENNQSIDHSGRNQTSLVGGWTNPFEKYARQNGSSPKLGWKKKILETTIYLDHCFCLRTNQPNQPTFTFQVFPQEVNATDLTDSGSQPLVQHVHRKTSSPQK